MAGFQNNSLLAALMQSMERIKTISRVCRALAKKPQLRNSIDAEYIQQETRGCALLTKDGPGVHKDLCLVAKVMCLKEMESMRLQGRALYVYVLSGKLQVRTYAREAWDSAAQFATRGRAVGASVDEPSALSASAAAPPAPLTATAASRMDGGKSATDGLPPEEEMLALFNSIDVDGSGAIDVEELQYALEMMGVIKTKAEVEELMAGVDEDGSGELEFEEFKQILAQQLGGGAEGKETEWAALGAGATGFGAGSDGPGPDGGLWAKEYNPGSSFGESAVLSGGSLNMDGMVLALEECDLLVLERSEYEHILECGFDGELQSKVALLRTAPVLTAVLQRTAVRALGYAAARHTFAYNSVIYEQGQPPNALYLIIQGECKVVTKVAEERPESPALQAESSAGSLSAQASHASLGGALVPPAHEVLRRGPRTRAQAARLMRRVEVAVLGPGDLCGEASVLGHERHLTGVIVSSRELVALRVDKGVLRRLVHPADIALLKQHFHQRDAERSARLATSSSVTQQLHESSLRARPSLTHASQSVLSQAGAGGVPRGMASPRSSGSQLNLELEGGLQQLGDAVSAASRLSAIDLALMPSGAPGDSDAELSGLAEPRPLATPRSRTRMGASSMSGTPLSRAAAASRQESYSGRGMRLPLPRCSASGLEGLNTPTQTPMTKNDGQNDFAKAVAAFMASAGTSTSGSSLTQVQEEGVLTGGGEATPRSSIEGHVSAGGVDNADAYQPAWLRQLTKIKPGCTDPATLAYIRMLEYEAMRPSGGKGAGSQPPSRAGSMSGLATDLHVDVYLRASAGGSARTSAPQSRLSVSGSLPTAFGSSQPATSSRQPPASAPAMPWGSFLTSRSISSDIPSCAAVPHVDSAAAAAAVVMSGARPRELYSLHPSGAATWRGPVPATADRSTATVRPLGVGQQLPGELPGFQGIRDEDMQQQMLTELHELQQVTGQVPDTASGMPLSWPSVSQRGSRNVEQQASADGACSTAADAAAAAAVGSPVVVPKLRLELLAAQAQPQAHAAQPLCSPKHATTAKLFGPPTSSRQEEPDTWKEVVPDRHAGTSRARRASLLANRTSMGPLSARVAAPSARPGTAVGSLSARDCHPKWSTEALKMATLMSGGDRGQLAQLYTNIMRGSTPSVGSMSHLTGAHAVPRPGAPGGLAASAASARSSISRMHAMVGLPASQHAQSQDSSMVDLLAQHGMGPGAGVALQPTPRGHTAALGSKAAFGAKGLASDSARLSSARMFTSRYTTLSASDVCRQGSNGLPGPAAKGSQPANIPRSRTVPHGPGATVLHHKALWPPAPPLSRWD